jgi:Ca-activated chloride channel homolog
MIPLELIRPWLLLLWLPAVLLVGYYFRNSLSDFPVRQRRLSTLVRAVGLLCLVLAAAGLNWLGSTDQQFVIVLKDESQSIGSQAQQRIEKVIDSLQQAKGPHRLSVLPFAAQPGTIRELAGRDSLAQSESRQEAFARTSTPSDDSDQTLKTRTAPSTPSDQQMQYMSQTNLASAMEAAAGYMPPGFVPHIVLLSDGNQTAGDALAAASRHRIPISTVALPSLTEPEVQVAEVNVPAEVREGEPFFVEVAIQSNHDDEGLVEIFRGDHKVLSERKQLKTGENRFRFQQTVNRDRLVAFQVRISQLGQDTLVDNNSAAGLVYSSGKPRVLIIESDPNLIRELAYSLEDEGIQVDIRPAQGMPETLADLQNYECLILSNVPATSLTEQQMRLTRTWVQELGGGVIMLGGEQSFGLGGYYKSTLEEILPVRSDFEKEKEKPSLAMVLVIDRSGSMSGDRIEMAKTAARSAVELLGRRDQVAVIAFDHETYLISEMQPATNQTRISDEISRIEAAGGTNMYPAMEEAFEILSRTQARLKHAIFLTDGISQEGDFEGMAAQMVSAKMTVSTVAVGDGSDTDMLEQVARVGKGRYYFTSDPAQVPQIFAKETVTASKSAIDEQPFIPQVVRASHALADLDMETAPFLLGYVMTRPKPTSEVILATEKGDPLLSWWRYGLGMSVAFTSDAKSRWAAEWLTWPGYGKFWTQVVRQTMRKSDTRGVSVLADRLGEQANWTIDAADELGQFMNSAQVEMTIIDPRLRRQSYILNQQAPGRYHGHTPLADAGSYHIDIAVKQNDQVVYRQTRGLIRGYSDELRIRPTDEGLLQQIAQTTSGTFNPAPEKFFETSPVTATRPFPLWPWLLALAIFILVLDVALRRIEFGLLSGSGLRSGSEYPIKKLISQDG